MKYTIYLILLVVIVGCSEDEHPTPLIQPQLLWKSPLVETGYVGSLRPVVYKNTVVFSKNYTGSVEKNEIIAYHKNTGEKLWKWDDFFTEVEGAPNSNTEYHHYQGILVFSTRRAVYAIDINTGQTLWRNKYEEVGLSRIRGYGDQLYHVQQPLDDSYVDIITASIYNGNWERVYRIEKEGNAKPYIQLPDKYINQQGDTILAFVHDTYDNTIPESKPFMAFYNQSKQELIRDGRYVNLGAGGYIYDGKIYVGGQELFCFDLETTELLWQRPVPTNSGMSGFLVAKDKLLTLSSDFDTYLFALNSDNGQVLWQQKVGANIWGGLHYHNGVLYYPDSKLQGLDIDTGEQLWELESPDYANDSGAFFEEAVTIDKETNRLYVSNYKNALCYQLPE